MTLELAIEYTPRPWQAIAEREIGDKRRAFLLWARRHGKDLFCWNYMILKALQKRGAYYYLYPRQNQARKAIWEGMTSQGKPFLDYIPKPLLAKDPNNTEMAITLVNGSIIRILGSDNYDALRSSNPIGIVLSEYAYHHPDVWVNVIEPILKENKGWAIFNTTPFGRNHAKDMWDYAVSRREIWYTQKITNDDSHLLSEEELNELRASGVSEETIQQEYYCNFDRGVEGSYYARIITQLRLDEHIKIVSKDDYAQVHTAWDLGFGDATSIFFYQLINNEIRIIDYYENQGEGLAHYCHILDEKKSKYKYNYGSHFVPHDAQAGSFELGITRVQYARELGLTMTVLRREGIDNGIERVRKLLPRTYIDAKKCDYAIRCLENYRKRYDEKNKVYSDAPLHDYTSHCFTGNTKVLTRNGTYQIIDLPKEGEILTLCGWKPYQNPRITRANAPLVEVQFKDGYTVKCTPDHLFLTANGWKSAQYLVKDLQIQSTLTQSHNTLTVDYTACGRMISIFHEVVKGFIEMCGELHLVKYLKAVTYTIKTEIILIINWIISNVFQPQSTLAYHGINQNTKEPIHSLSKQEIKQLSGIDLKKEDCGIRDTLKDHPIGKPKREKSDHVYSVKRNSIVSFEKVQLHKNIAQITAKLPIIESVKHLKETQDVWCLTVPEHEHFSLSNGAVVHNCADALRYLCQAVEAFQSGSSVKLEEYRVMKRKHGIGNQQDNNSILGPTHE